ncbi:MAG: thioredoxin family protein [Eubacterium sp.]|nr:thioredoxin family protein [Eubacterium sp.]
MAITYATDENYYDLVKEGVVLVDFFGKTCVPCKMLARVLEEIDDEFPFVNIVKVDTDDCPERSKEFDINGIPDLYYYKDGKVVMHEPGAVDAEYIKERLAEMLY